MSCFVTRFCLDLFLQARKPMLAMCHRRLLPLRRQQRQAKGRAQVSLFSLSSSHSLSSSNSGCLLQELIKVSLHHLRFLRTVRPLCSRASLVFWCITCVLCRHYSSRRCAHCHTSFRIEFCSFFFVCAGKKSGAPPPPPLSPPPSQFILVVLLCRVFVFVQVLQ